MAFTNNKLSVIIMCGGWTHWLYNNKQETVTDIKQVGYFNPMIAIMSTGDLITLVGKDTVEQKYIFINNGEVVLMELGK